MEQVVTFFKKLAQRFNIVPPNIEYKRANLENHRILHVHYKCLDTGKDKGLIILGEYRDKYKEFGSEPLPDSVFNADIAKHSLKVLTKKESFSYDK